jgi:hypothetical protein
LPMGTWRRNLYPQTSGSADDTTEAVRHRSTGRAVGGRSLSYSHVPPGIAPSPPPPLPRWGEGRKVSCRRHCFLSPPREWVAEGRVRGAPFPFPTRGRRWPPYQYTGAEYYILRPGFHSGAIVRSASSAPLQR